MSGGLERKSAVWTKKTSNILSPLYTYMQIVLVAPANVMKLYEKAGKVIHS